MVADGKLNKPMKKLKKTIKEEFREFIKQELLAITPYDEKKVLKFIKRVLQRFIEETRKEEFEYFKDRGHTEFGKGWLRGIIDGYNQALQDIKQKQIKWQKENLN